MDYIFIWVLSAVMVGRSIGAILLWLVPGPPYVYMCSYHHKTGMGTAIITRNKKVRTSDDVVAMQLAIECQCKVEHVGLINYILLKK